MRPSVTARYLVPCVPGLLLGVAILARDFGQRWAPAPIILVLTFAGAACNWGFTHGLPAENVYNFESASKWLMASNVKNLVFFWDNPSASFEHPSTLDAVGGFFFRREGQPVTVSPMVIGKDDDPSSRLIQAADQPNSGILWLYDLKIHGTSARSKPPRISSLDPSWRCRDFGLAAIGIGVLACDRPGAT